MSPETLRTLAGATLIALPLWCLVVVLSFAVFRPAVSSMQAAPVAPVASAPKPHPLAGRIDRISAPRSDKEALKRVGYVVVHEGRESVIMVKQLKD